MDIITLFTLAVGLAMDAFAVSICKGLAQQKLSLKHMLIAGLWFGGFQALMPTLGYFLGSQFRDKITAIDHWIAFILLGFIGVNMIRESLDKGDVCPVGGMGVKEMFPLAVATSIDALAVGITFAFLKVNILVAAGLIGIVTFVISGIGVRVGNIFGSKYKSRAELAGGIILVLLGLKILLEHLEIL
ncbi:MAG TPA: manganese efflux pump MntP family protein [Candidatus Blautia pullicola]|uniref:Putative manganese efflux pump MntP n=1 Tax=Candidatus Blautia pullicola TaxID=2838498 RepID=A0A9D2JTU3_9FIRM|nr:manganese efflux pump MntP family protein [Candidatus Blautia pullicola]